MKRLLFTLFAVCAAFFTAVAQTPGYAIFGDVPYGYTDVRSSVNVPNVSEGILTISGTQHSSHICQNASTSIEVKPSSNFDMTLSGDFAIHMKIKKAEGTNNNVQLSFCCNNWNSIRAGFLIGTTSLPTDDFEEVIIKHSDKMVNGGGQYYCDGNLTGTHTWNSNGDFLRIAAATGEAIYISQIYIEVEHTEPLTPQDPKRYYFVRGGALPVIDGVECVDLRATIYSAWGTNSISAPTLNDNGASFTLQNSWFAADLKPKTQCMADVRKADWYLRMKFKTDASSLANQNLRINLSNDANNFHLTNDYGDGEWHDISFALADAANTLRTFPVSANDIAFQLHANGSLNGTYFYIEYAYLTNDPTTDEKPTIVDNVPPTNFSVTEKAGATTHNKATLQLYAEDEDTPITYTIHYAVKNSGVVPTEVIVNGAQGTTVEKEISGLLPETTYSFSVVASDPNGNETTATEIDITTTTLVETRYYFFRGDPAYVSLPSTGVISYDLREGVGSTVGNGGGFTHSQKKYYTAFVNGGSGWWSFNQNLSSAKDMSEISQADWYLVVKFRTTITYGNFNIRLNNAVSYLNGQNLTYESDGSWNVLTLALADAKNTLNYSALQTGTVFQFHADGGTGYLDIAYAYLTNNAASVDDFVDNVAPVISSMSDGDKTTSSVVLTVTASDDSGEDITYIVKEGTAVLTSTPATGAPGTATAITVSELVGQNHTLTVIARDGAGNEVSKNINVGLLDADTPPHDLVVTTTHDDRSVTFTMTAEDNNSALTYAILDGEDNVLEDNIVGISGEAKVYKLTGLTPETNYSFKVRVTDNGSNSITSDAINITTDAFVAHRFYLLRGDNSDVPSAADLSSTLVNCNVEYGNSSRDTRAEDYISVKTNNNWMAVTLKPTATIANEINDDWYIVVRFRSNLSNNVFGFNNFRLNLSNNAKNWYINNSDGDKPFGRDYNDGNWIVIKKKIGDRRAGSAVPASYLQAGEVAAQLHVNANLIAGEFLDIDYIYFTDDVTNVDEGTQFNKRIALKDAEDNTSVLSANNGQTVDIDLTRSLTNASYNTLCLPFDLSSEQVEATFGAGTSIGQLTSARIKENDELYLNFSFVNAMEAGVPYIIQPENNVANPLIENVTIDNTLRPADFEHVAFKGVFSPKEIEVQSADSYSILLLGANNTLSWPNTTANMKGMRAYFDLSTQASMIVRRASFGFHQEGQATGIEEIPSQQQSAKILRNGQLYIIRNGEEYTITGARVK